jgi:nucleoside 2-deoxyribosyltransferase
MVITMYSVYVAGDLFDFKHITGNFVLAQYLEQFSNGLYKCILPQNWEGAMHSSVSIRNKDIAQVLHADLVLFNFDGTDLDSGTVVEFMVAKMLDIPCVLLRTDFRNGGYLFNEDWNLMLSGFPRSVICKLPSLTLYNEKGLQGLHQTIAQSVIKAFETVLHEKSVLNTYEELLSVYQHVVTMCGARLDQLVPLARLHTIIEGKVEKGVYATSKKSDEGQMVLN